MGDVETTENSERPTEPGFRLYDQWVDGIESDLDHRSATIRTRGALKQIITQSAIYGPCMTLFSLIIYGVSRITPLQLFSDPWHDIPVAAGSLTLVLLTTTMQRWLVQDDS